MDFLRVSSGNVPVFALFGSTVDTYFFKVVFMPVVMLDRHFVRDSAETCGGTQVQFLLVVLMPAMA